MDSDTEITFSLNRPLRLEHSSNSSKTMNVKEIVMHIRDSMEDLQKVVQEMVSKRNCTKLTVI